MIANSDPAGARVAPYGGTEALFTPDPFAIGYPGTPNPVLVDICASITTTSMTRQKVAEGAQFDQPWLLDHEGRPTTDPRVLEHSTPRGSLQLIGGLDHGHKGFGLALMVEALSQGLAGHGRVDAPKRWGGNTYPAGDRPRAVRRPRRVRATDGPLSAIAAASTSRSMPRIRCVCRAIRRRVRSPPRGATASTTTTPRARRCNAARASSAWHSH